MPEISSRKQRFDGGIMLQMSSYARCDVVGRLYEPTAADVSYFLLSASHDQLCSSAAV